MDLDWNSGGGWMMMNSGPDVTLGPRNMGLFVKDFNKISKNADASKRKRGIKNPRARSENIDVHRSSSSSSDKKVQSLMEEMSCLRDRTKQLEDEKRKLQEMLDDDKGYSSNMLKNLPAYRTSQNQFADSGMGSMQSFLPPDDEGYYEDEVERWLNSSDQMWDHDEDDEDEAGSTVSEESDFLFNELSVEFRSLSEDLEESHKCLQNLLERHKRRDSQAAGGDAASSTCSAASSGSTRLAEPCSQMLGLTLDSDTRTDISSDQTSTSPPTPHRKVSTSTFIRQTKQERDDAMEGRANAEKQLALAKKEMEDYKRRFEKAVTNDALFSLELETWQDKMTSSVLSSSPNKLHTEENPADDTMADT